MALSREVKECRKRLGELERCRLAETDPLTGLHNGKTAVPLMKEWIEMCIRDSVYPIEMAGD